MKKVAIVMGSQSDMKIADKATEIFDRFSIPYEVKIMSAHRTPIRVKKFAKSLEENGFGVVIGIAGLAAHLPGVLASLTILPVIGVPGDGGPLRGEDALLSIVQMPSGIPVATVGIANGKNAALLATQMLSLSEPSLVDALKNFRAEFGDDTE